MLAACRPCLDCDHFWYDGPMLQDELWLSIAQKQDILCFCCIEQRLGRALVAHDLKDVPLNRAYLILMRRAER